MIQLLSYPAAPLALCIGSLKIDEPKRMPTVSQTIWEAHRVIANPASRAQEVKNAKRTLLRALGKSKSFHSFRDRRFPVVLTKSKRQVELPRAPEKGQTKRLRQRKAPMKRSRIDLAQPFEKVLATVLSAPGKRKVSNQRLIENANDPMRPQATEYWASDPRELKKALRCLYEAANGRQVETSIGLVAIAPPVAPFLKETPFDVDTQLDFFLEAIARIIVRTSHRNGGIPISHGIPKNHAQRSDRGDSSESRPKNGEVKIALPPRSIQPRERTLTSRENQISPYS